MACGTSYHAGLIGRYAIEEWAGVPVEMDIASEYRYRNPVVGTGRPRDRHHPVRRDRRHAGRDAHGARARRTVLAVTNVMGSQATRDADGVLFTRAGLEIGVAATKTFICQVAVMYLLALRLAELRGKLPPERLASSSARSSGCRTASTRCSPTVQEQVGRSPRPVRAGEFFLYIGRHIGLPVALEGALKLKEISYIATDAYAAGEMKHGPIALLDESTPVVCVATDSPVLEKVASNMQEVRARGARVIAIATEGNARIAEYADDVIRCRRSTGCCSRSWR